MDASTTTSTTSSSISSSISSNSGITSTITFTATGTRVDDDAAHRRAIDHVVATLGLDATPTVWWDDEHHLQGHLDVAGRHLVLIATRTTTLAPRLLTEDEWDCLRHGSLAA